ncbi:hypothetical protein HY839_01220 [Candidatus Azambacteria bacterium]|nr:hypothetical protein [Candidatus Azambacteria bacterium]
MAKTPKPGEVWEVSFGKGFGLAACLIYEKDSKLYLAWFGVPWDIKEVDDKMVDGENEWRRVYSPTK